MSTRSACTSLPRHATPSAQPTRVACLFTLLLAVFSAPVLAADPAGGIALDWPMGQVQGGEFVPGYNVRVMQNFANVNPDYGSRRHAALDLSYNSGSTVGAEVRAAADGTVHCVLNANYPGWVIVLEHTPSSGAKFYSQYGHLGSTSVVLGQRVNRGSLIGTVIAWPNNVGNTHLHFEVRSFGNWPANGSCAGPGYADSGYTPTQQGWFDPIQTLFQRRPSFPGQIRPDAQVSVRAAASRSAAVLGQVVAGNRLLASGAFADAGNGDWWHRIEYAAGQWGYVSAFYNLGWGGEIYSVEPHRYPGPVDVADALSAGGELYVFARASNGALSYRRRSSAGSWSAWVDLGGNATTSPAAVVNSDGRVQVFVRGTDGALYTRRQVSSGSNSWDAWAGLAGELSSAPAVVANSNGRLQVFVRWSDGSLRTRQQTSAGGSWGGWTSLGGVLHWGPAAALNSDGRVAVFVGGLDNDLFQIVQTSAGGGFGSFQSLGGGLSSHPSVVRNSDGRLEVFVRGTDHALRHIKQNSAGGSWGAWQSRGGVLTAYPKAAVHSSGRIEVFTRGGESQLASIAQASAGGSWGAWNNLTGYLTAGPVAAAQGGTLHVIVLGQNGELFQRGYGSSWSGYFSLGGTFAPP